MIHLVLVALAVHLVSTVLTMQPITITLPRWAWHALWGAVCVTLACVTLGADRWLQGLAAGGIALLLSRLDDFDDHPAVAISADAADDDACLGLQPVSR